VLTIDEMATLYRRAKSTIRRRIQQGRFRPAPYDGPPYRWLRAHIEVDLQRRVKRPRAATR
jgi:IS30 family transposase